MRSSKFTFKKTKRIVEVHKGVCLDLTEEEAHSLMSLASWVVTDGAIAKGRLSDDIGMACGELVKHLSEALYALDETYGTRVKAVLK